MTIVIDFGEKEYVGDILDKLNVDYKIEKLQVWACMKCDKIYKFETNKCECGGLTEVIRAGDITNERRSFLIERKKGQNLYSSVRNGEIYEQIEKMSMVFEGNYSIVFEGNIMTLAENNEDRKEQILSIPATCQQYGASFISVKSLFVLIAMLRYFDYKSGKKPKFRRKLHRIHEKKSNLWNYLVTLKGIGPKTASLIDKKYSCVGELVYDLTSDSFDRLLSIKGIGKKTCQRMQNYVMT